VPPGVAGLSDDFELVTTKQPGAVAVPHEGDPAGVCELAEA
jgi:hypothetical protein